MMQHTLRPLAVATLAFAAMLATGHHARYALAEDPANCAPGTGMHFNGSEMVCDVPRGTTPVPTPNPSSTPRPTPTPTPAASPSDAVTRAEFNGLRDRVLTLEAHHMLPTPGQTPVAATPTPTRTPTKSATFAPTPVLASCGPSRPFRSPMPTAAQIADEKIRVRAIFDAAYPVGGPSSYPQSYVGLYYFGPQQVAADWIRISSYYSAPGNNLTLNGTMRFRMWGGHGYIEERLSQYYACTTWPFPSYTDVFG